MGQGIGQWGMFEAVDGEAAAALLAKAEEWLRGEGMTRAIGPFSLSIWDEPGLLIEGFAEPPTVMMGHHKPEYQRWIEAAGYAKAKDLLTYELDIVHWDSRRSTADRHGRAQRAHPHPHGRQDALRRGGAAHLGILNDAWSDNWGYVPLTAAEIAYAGKKLKPIVFEDLVRIADVDGEPVAFMMTLARHQRVHHAI